MSKIAVLDTCVLFPAPLRDTLLRAADANLYRLRWSDEILRELHRNLIEDRGLNTQQADRLIGEMRSSFPEALVTGYESRIPAMTNHPKDQHVLAVAVEARAETIVTFNRRHFPRRSLSPFSIEAKSPDEFLLELLSLYSQAMVRILREQAADLGNPPMTVQEVLAKIAREAPRFAAAVVL